MSRLEAIIDSPANLEMKSALAVRMILFDFKTEALCALFNVSNSFVSKGKIIFANEGTGALKVNYQGGTGFLTEDQRDESIFSLRMQSHSSVEALRDYRERHYGVIYHSTQSYSDLLKAGGLSWHQTQAATPKRDEAQGWRKREELKKTSDAPGRKCIR